MRLKKRGKLDASAKQSPHSAKPISREEELNLIGGVRSSAAPPPRRAEAPASIPSPRGADGRVVRRQQYAPTYQVGRKFTAGLAAPSALPAAPSASGGFSAAAPERAGLARPWLIAAALCSAAVLTAGVFFGVAELTRRPAPASGVEVFLGTRMLCVAQSQDQVQKAYDGILTELKASYGMDVQQGEALSFSPVLCDRRNILDIQAITAAIKGNLDVKVLAAVILVNDRPAVALKTSDEAQQTLDGILAPFQSAPAQLYRTDVGFVENVRIAQMPADFSLIKSISDATRALTLGADVEDNPYTVKKGDTLGKIAKKFNLKISDLRTANPLLAANGALQPGQELNAVKPDNWVSVRYTDTVTREETLPFDTVQQTSDSLFTTQQQVKQAGKNGQREVVAKVTYVNGIEAGQDVLSQTVLQAAQDQIVVRGTKTLSGSSGSGAASAGNGYIKPLKSYVITSTFRVRTLNGVTRWHYGVDLAAPKGTPIYAAKTGTVTFSGSASGYGELIKIDVGGGVENRYGHMSKILVKKGQKVKQGDVIGLVGATGDATGPHLHFEIRVNGTPVDPMKYVKLEADLKDWAYM